MDDLISRQDTVNELREYITEPSISDDESEIIGYNDGIELAISVLSTMPSAQQWIPCSERLPKRKYETQMRGYYLTTNIYGSVGVTKYEFEVGGLGYAWDSNIRIVAWMPLPDVYKGEKE